MSAAIATVELKFAPSGCSIRVVSSVHLLHQVRPCSLAAAVLQRSRSSIQAASTADCLHLELQPLLP